MKITKVSSIAVTVALLFAVSASAQEKIKKIALDHTQKQHLVDAMQSQISRHEHMSRAQILQDWKALLERNAEKAVAQKLSPKQQDAFKKSLKATYAELTKARSAEALVAIERAQLQQVMSADCYTFSFTQKTFQDGGFVAILELPYALALDLLLLPITVFTDIAIFFGF